MIETIRSGFSIAGIRLFCDHEKGSFVVQSRWQRFYTSADVYEALAVFEGLCLEELPGKVHAGHLATEIKRNKRARFTSPSAWESHVIECARRRSEGFKPVTCGSKGAVEKWVRTAITSHLLPH